MDNWSRGLFIFISISALFLFLFKLKLMSETISEGLIVR